MIKAGLMDVVSRLTAVLDHLGIKAAHIATQMPMDIAGLAEASPDRIKGVVLCVPTRLDPAPFRAVSSRLLIIAGATGITAETSKRGITRLPGAQLHVLADYDASGWSDVAADRPAELADTMVGFLAAQSALAAADVARGESSGSHAGITYTIAGNGPPLILLPFFLAPSQWEPVRAKLATHFTVIELGGQYIGGVAALEDRARAPTYRAMFHTLVDHLNVGARDRILDVGCGSGALARQVAQRSEAYARIDAVDINSFLLREAEALAREADLVTPISFVRGSALALPFPDASFDAIYSVTVLEECDADAAIAEMLRVAKPGARIGIAVRAIDLHQWWNLSLPEEIRAKTAVPPQSVSPGGVADATLYGRMLRAGLRDLTPFPYLVTLTDPGGSIWRYREDHARSILTGPELEQWQAARTAAAAEGTLMQSHALHCAVGTKPA